MRRLFGEGSRGIVGVGFTFQGRSTVVSVFVVAEALRSCVVSGLLVLCIYVVIIMREAG